MSTTTLEQVSTVLVSYHAPQQWHISIEDDLTTDLARLDFIFPQRDFSDQEQALAAAEQIHDFITAQSLREYSLEDNLTYLPSAYVLDPQDIHSPVYTDEQRQVIGREDTQELIQGNSRAYDEPASWQVRDPMYDWEMASSPTSAFVGQFQPRPRFWPEKIYGGQQKVHRR